MQDTLEFDPAIKVRWQNLHADYVLAHKAYLALKLQREASDGQVSDPTAMSNARSHLETAHMAMHNFCRTYAEFC